MNYVDRNDLLVEYHKSILLKKPSLGLVKLFMRISRMQFAYNFHPDDRRIIMKNCVRLQMKHWNKLDLKKGDILSFYSTICRRSFTGGLSHLLERNAIYRKRKKAIEDLIWN